MQRLFFTVSFTFCLFGIASISLAGNNGSSTPLYQSNSGQLLRIVISGQNFLLDVKDGHQPDTTMSTSGDSKKGFEWTPRRVNSLIMSVVVPGSGQTMLGDTYKGLGFTLAYFGFALTAIISHNNFIARGERLDALEYQYANSTNWTSSNIIYGQMKESHDLLKQDRKRRNVFLVVSAVIWIANIADVLYNTEDSGEKVFSHSIGKNNGGRTVATLSDPYSTTLLSFSIPLGK